MLRRIAAAIPLLTLAPCVDVARAQSLETPQVTPPPPPPTGTDKPIIISEPGGRITQFNYDPEYNPIYSPAEGQELVAGSTTPISWSPGSIPANSTQSFILCRLINGVYERDPSQAMVEGPNNGSLLWRVPTNIEKGEGYILVQNYRGLSAEFRILNAGTIIYNMPDITVVTTIASRNTTPTGFATYPTYLSDPVEVSTNRISAGAVGAVAGGSVAGTGLVFLGVVYGLKGLKRRRGKRRNGRISEGSKLEGGESGMAEMGSPTGDVERSAAELSAEACAVQEMSTDPNYFEMQGEAKTEHHELPVLRESFETKTASGENSVDEPRSSSTSRSSEVNADS